MPDGSRPIDELTKAFIAALRRLGAAGEPEAASRLAAQAWVTLRRDEPRLAERINGAMHHLARLEAASATGRRRTDGDGSETAPDEGPGPSADGNVDGDEPGSDLGEDADGES